MTSWRELRAERGERFQGHPHRGRYAPSPTGPLHLGNIRTALIAWLQARLSGAGFVMRMEDLDENRALEGCDQEIYENLHWLGLDWDEGPEVGGPCGPYTQSERKEFYQAALDYLEEGEQVFRCYCSRKDIREASSAPHKREIIYPGTCRELSREDEAEVQKQKPDRKPSYRIRADDDIIEFEDQIAGAFAQHLAHEVGDFVLRRTDEFFAYQLAVVVDDYLMGITDVVRGEDLLDSTARQIWLYRKLGCPEIPDFWHVPLMTDEEGNRMSKRDGSLSLAQLRKEGATPEQVVGRLAASVGWVEEGTEISASALLDKTDLDAIRNLN